MTGNSRRRVMAALLFGAAVAVQAAAIHSSDAQSRSAPPSPQERAMFARAQTLQAAGQTAEAAAALETFLTTYPQSGLGAQAKTLLGHIRLEQKAYQQAVAILSEVVTREPESEYIDRARLDLASSYLALNKRKHAARLLEDVAGSKAMPGLRRQAFDLLAALATESGDAARAISLLMDERELPDEVVDAEVIEKQVLGTVAQSQDPQAMETVASRFRDRFPADAALLRAAQLYGLRGEWFQQERRLLRFLSAFPQHPRLAEARKSLEDGRTRLRAFRHAIGVPLPYDGVLQPYAASILRGAQLAVEHGRSELPDQSIGLVVKDYGGDLTRLASAVDELVFDYRCVALLGPVLSREVTVVMPRAQQGRTPMISPSLSGPVPPNRYLFRTALTAQVEGAAVAEYAMERLGLTRFAVLAPTDRYSSDVVAVFRDEVARRGGKIVFMGSYEPDTVDFGKHLKNLKERDLEQEGMMDRLEADPASPVASQPPPVYIPGFDAVFLPGDGETAGLIAAQLRFYDIALPLLGTSGWNGREVLSSGGRFVEEAVFVDGFFSNAQDAVVQQFVTQFRARYREEPDAFAAQAYDAVRLIIQAIKTGGTSGDLVRDELARMTGYHGVSGVTGFGPDGEALRRLSWIQVRNGRFVPAL